MTAPANRTGPLALLALLAAVPHLAADDSALAPAQKNHWAWKVPARPALPAVKAPGWVRNPIDAFILAKLEAAGLSPAAPASREQLIRRVTFDLTGLPPTPEEIDDFVKDDLPDAWEKVIDRLLASPHYGERWGRHWLDLARFAECNGYEFDEIRPDAWRYRDYVIDSFNADKPYDRFVKEQLAGDELFPDDPAARVATAFNLLGPDMTDSADQAQRRQNTLNDMTDTAGLAFLGLTMGCARCHDHKFEPIPQGDYYRLQAFFAPAAFRRDLVIAPKEQRAAHAAAQREYEALVRPTREALAKLEEPYRKKLREARLARLSDEARAAHRTPPEQRTAVQKELVEKTNRLLAVPDQAVLQAMTAADRAKHEELREQLRRFDGRRPPPLPVAMGLQDSPGPPPRTFLLERGELGNRGEEVRPGYPVILSPRQEPAPARIRPASSTSTGRRTALAEWIVRRDNPLTARVMVNRLWQHHFGRGLVGTPSDFGLRGERPTHPELLDWLACEFICDASGRVDDEASGRVDDEASGGVDPRRPWSLKRLHRLMLTSATYQQSTRPSPDARRLDPDNRLLSHMNRLRLEGEVIRDSLLAVGGRLNLKMGGPGVFPPLPAEMAQAAKVWKPSPDPRDHVRRSVYVFARRNVRFPFLETFDLPDSNLSCPKRERSTTAPQALALLNDADVMRAAKALAARLEREAAGDGRIVLAYRLALGRRPTERELEMGRDFLGRSPLSELCRALFNVNEFVYLD
ncbi:MAG TPA: DUF1549 and DUF1553 domain-containing protein [Gemmataceae bacterium]|nr:DUF1549 and DUF1553 domain-containing protein [Gemmataceae bacterium]